MNLDNFLISQLDSLNEQVKSKGGNKMTEMTLKEAIAELKELKLCIIGRSQRIWIDREACEAIDTVIAEVEKPTYTPADMEEFSYWYHRKVSVIGESELHLFGVRPFEDIISFWKKEKEATE